MKHEQTAAKGRERDWLKIPGLRFQSPFVSFSENIAAFVEIFQVFNTLGSEKRLTKH